MSNKSEKPYILKWIIGCGLVILIFHFAWAAAFFHNLGNPVFTAIDAVLIGFFLDQSIRAYRHADDPKRDWKRLAFILLAVASSVWAGIWSTELITNIAEGIAG